MPPQQLFGLFVVIPRRQQLRIGRNQHVPPRSRPPGASRVSTQTQGADDADLHVHGVGLLLLLLRVAWVRHRPWRAMLLRRLLRVAACSPTYQPPWRLPGGKHIRKFAEVSFRCATIQSRPLRPKVHRSTAWHTGSALYANFSCPLAEHGNWRHRLQSFCTSSSLLRSTPWLWLLLLRRWRNWGAPPPAGMEGALKAWRLPRPPPPLLAPVVLLAPAFRKSSAWILK